MIIGQTDINDKSFYFHVLAFLFCYLHICYKYILSGDIIGTG